jgi:WD40 repeat protein
LLAAGAEDGSIRLWKVGSWEEQSPLHWHKRLVTALAFSPDGRWLASAGHADRKIQITDLGSGKGVYSTKVPGDGVSLLKVAFSADAKTLAYGGTDDKIRLWDLEKKQESVLGGNAAGVTGLAFDPTGRLLASSSGAAVRFWDLSAPAQPKWIVSGAFGDTARHIAFTPEGRYLVVAGSNRMASVLRTPALPPSKQ